MARGSAGTTNMISVHVKGTAKDKLLAYKLKIERVCGMKLNFSQVGSLLIMAGADKPLGEVFTSLEQLDDEAMEDDDV